MRKRVYNTLLCENGGKIHSVYEYFQILCIIVSIVPLFFKKTYQAFFWIDRITAAIFICDYILRWITADYKYSENKLFAFIRYPFGFFAIIDLLSILPVVTILNNGFKLLKLFRLIKSFKVLKFLRYSKSFNIIISVIKKEQKSLLAVCYLAGGYILISALIMLQVEPGSFDTFFDALYWSVVTLTTVGYGDIYPTSDVGRVVGMISSFMGIAIVALPTGIITAGYMNALNDK